MTTAQRGYGAQHQQERARIAPSVERGEAYCTEPICLEPTRWIEPGTPWHLVHDHNTGETLGPGHRRCNLGERNRRYGGPRFLGPHAMTPLQMVPALSSDESDGIRFGGVGLRPELLWDAHIAADKPWLAPLFDVPPDAGVPLAMTPAHPDAEGSYGAEAIEWIEDVLGHPLRWWQKLATVRQLEHDEDGRLCWSVVIESGSRRVGKSVRLRGMALWRIVKAPELFPEPQLAIHTGKDLSIVREIQRRAWPWAEANGWRPTRSVGREGIESDGGEHRWLARSTENVYGYDVTLGMVDEAWAVEEQTIAEGLEPATLERLSPQILLTSTAHRRATGLMRSRIREALMGEDGQTLLMLWSVPDGMDMGLEATWRAASAHWSEDRARLVASKYARASMGQQDAELDDPDPLAGFASQYLNCWQLQASRPGTVIDPLIWESCLGDADVVGRLGDCWYSVEVETGQLSASIGCAGDSQDGRRWVDVEHRPGIHWVAERLTELGSPPVVMNTDPSAAAPLVRALEDAGIWVLPIYTRSRVQACGQIQADILDRRLAQPGVPALDEAVKAAQKRDIGDHGGWEWGRKRSGADISPLQAVTWALWLLRNNEDPTIWHRR